MSQDGTLGMIHGSYENGHQSQLTRSSAPKGLAEVFGSQVFSDFVHATSQILVSEEGFDSTTAKPLFARAGKGRGRSKKCHLFQFLVVQNEKTSDFTTEFQVPKMEGF